MASAAVDPTGIAPKPTRPKCLAVVAKLRTDTARKEHKDGNCGSTAVSTGSNGNDPERVLSVDGHVGFDSIPDQLINKTMKDGFTFNILCIGATGIGKSTLMDSLFNTKFDSEESSHNLDLVKLRSKVFDLEEKGVQLKLNIIETAGYGDQLNKEGTFSSIAEYVDAQFESYLREEMKFKRSFHDYDDTRVHVCLYLICPTRMGLKPIDIACLKTLDTKVNIIPILAKADAIPLGALQMYKDKVNADLISNGINTYQFPTDDESVAEINRSMNSKQPFAVVASNELVRVGNKVVRARLYPWGVVQVENENHCDFVHLREMLLRTNMEDLRDQTHFKHYERYRQGRLEQMGFTDTDTSNQAVTPERAYENRKQMFQHEFEQKGRELLEILERRCGEVNEDYDLAEAELQKRRSEMEEEYLQTKKSLENERKSLDDHIGDFIRLTTAFTNKFAKTSSSSSLFGTLGRCNRK